MEIASPGTCRRDDGIKRRLYERAGVSEYWIVDPDLDRIRVHTREGDSFGRAMELSREHGDLLSTPLLPGLEMPLARIFRLTAVGKALVDKERAVLGSNPTRAAAPPV